MRLEFSINFHRMIKKAYGKDQIKQFCKTVSDQGMLPMEGVSDILTF